MRESRNQWLLGSLSLVAIIAVVAHWAWPRKLNVEAETRRGLMAVLEGDASYVFARINPAEIQAAGLTEAKVQAFLDRIFRPSLKGWEIEKIQIDSLEGGVLKAGIATFADGRGGRLIFSMGGVDGSDRVIFPNFILSMSQNAILARNPELVPRRGEERVRGWVQHWDTIAKEAKAIGIRGLATEMSGNPHEGDLAFRTWDQQKAYYRELLARAEKKRAEMARAGQ